MEDFVPNTDIRVNQTHSNTMNKNLMLHDLNLDLEDTHRSDDELTSVEQIAMKRDRRSLKMIKVDLHQLPSTEINLLSGLEVAVCYSAELEPVSQLDRKSRP